MSKNNLTQIVQLHKLPQGVKAIVRKFNREDIFLKTLEMGMLPNTIIELVGIAPLGDPICVKVLETLLSIRKSEAEHIEVEIINEL
jgi:ferrous iron transport protein A